MKAKYLLFALLLLPACPKTSNKQQPPPIQNGHCLVDRYDGPRAMRQICNYQGYNWKCGLADDRTVNVCDRGPEATSERVPVAEPPAPVEVLDAGVDASEVDAP